MLLLAVVVVGLSPRVRGNRAVATSPLDAERSIPACTGKPKVLLPRSNQKGVYPRVYGETVVDRPAYKESTGLSPRVRGNHILARAR